MDRAANANTSHGCSLETDGGEDFGTDFRESTVEVDTADIRSSRSASGERTAHGPATKQRLGEGEVYCWSCGVPIMSAAEICPECGTRQRPPPNQQRKNPGLAALASVVWTGAGQIYNGEIAKGIGLMALMFVSTLMIFVLIGFVTTPLIWAYAVYDAYRTAERINQRPATPNDEF